MPGRSLFLPTFFRSFPWHLFVTVLFYSFTKPIIVILTFIFIISIEVSSIISHYKLERTGNFSIMPFVIYIFAFLICCHLLYLPAPALIISISAFYLISILSKYHYSPISVPCTFPRIDRSINFFIFPCIILSVMSIRSSVSSSSASVVPVAPLIPAMHTITNFCCNWYLFKSQLSRKPSCVKIAGMGQNNYISLQQLVPALAA